MGIFSRNGTGHESSAEPEDLDHQGMALELIDGFVKHDQAGLDALDAAGRATQAQARWALYLYVDKIWEKAKREGLHPADRPGWSVVAGLRDLTNALWVESQEAQSRAGDDVT